MFRFNELETLLPPIEPQNLATSAEAIRSTTPLEVPQLLEGRVYPTSVVMSNFWHGNALHDQAAANDFVSVGVDLGYVW